MYMFMLPDDYSVKYSTEYSVCTVLAKRKSQKVRVDPGQNPTAGFFQGWVLLVLLTSGALSNLVLIDTVIQRWLLAINRDCIAVGLSFESPVSLNCFCSDHSPFLCSKYPSTCSPLVYEVLVLKIYIWFSPPNFFSLQVSSGVVDTSVDLAIHLCNGKNTTVSCSAFDRHSTVLEVGDCKLSTECNCDQKYMCLLRLLFGMIHIWSKDALMQSTYASTESFLYAVHLTVTFCRRYM